MTGEKAMTPTEEEDTQTVGDGITLECPWCGLTIWTQDAHTDGALEAGYEAECEHCHKAFVIDAVDYDVTVYASRKKGDVK